MIFGAKSDSSDQVDPPGHLAVTCAHHNLGNEFTVEVNWQGKIAMFTVLYTKY